MQSTTLKLLTSEGVVAFTFAPALTSERYDELLSVVKQASTPDELRAMIRNCAVRWQVTVEVGN